MQFRSPLAAVVLLVGTFSIHTVTACSSEEATPSGDIGDPGSPGGPVVGSDENANLPIPDLGPKTDPMLRTTGNVNLREKPSTDSAVLRVLEAGTLVTLLDPTAQNGFFHVSATGLVGWLSGKYVEPAALELPVGTDLNGAPTPDNAIARAKTAMGFSYYWGGGGWLATGPTADTKGSCSGSCPSCTHSGKYGADCSGLVAKTWQLGNKDLSVNEHPYATADFVKPKTGVWADVPRANAKLGDALTYNASGHGHIALYEKGDPWGQPFVYECKGCAYGCVYNSRSFGSEYKAIRRAGF